MKVISLENNDLNNLFKENSIEKEIDNKLYIKEKRPNWCVKKYKNGKRVPCFSCLSHDDNPNGDKCLFFAFAEVEKEDKKKFDLAYRE